MLTTILLALCILGILFLYMKLSGLGEVVENLQRFLHVTNQHLERIDSNLRVLQKHARELSGKQPFSPITKHHARLRLSLFLYVFA
jgi:hypothetical protein